MTVLCTTLQSRPHPISRWKQAQYCTLLNFFSSSSYSSLDLVVCTLNFLEVKNYQIHDKSLTKFCIHNDNRKNNQIIHFTWGQITIHILIDELVSSFSRERWSLLNIERLRTFFLLDIEQCGMLVVVWSLLGLAQIVSRSFSSLGSSLSTGRADQFFCQDVEWNTASGEMDSLVIFSTIITDAKLGQGFITIVN